MCVCYLYIHIAFERNMNGETLSHIAEQAKLIEILCARIEELEKDMNEFMENEGVLWVYTQEGMEVEE